MASPRHEAELLLDYLRRRGALSEWYNSTDRANRSDIIDEIVYTIEKAIKYNKGLKSL